MAGDWIKFELATSDKPEVWAIADALGLDPDAVVGKLLRVWAWFDQHTEKGNAPSVTKKLLDRSVGVSGFCDSLISQDWLLESENIISIPNFDRHNGETAKTRALTAKRVAKHKKSNGNGNAKGNGDSVTLIVNDALPKEEKRRYKENNKKKNFQKPTPEEIQKYCDERKNGLSGEDIFNHYEANGWVRGKTKIKDWRACVRTWEKNKSNGSSDDWRSSMTAGGMV